MLRVITYVTTSPLTSLRMSSASLAIARTSSPRAVKSVSTSRSSSRSPRSARSSAASIAGRMGLGVYVVGGADQALPDGGCEHVAKDRRIEPALCGVEVTNVLGVDAEPRHQL